MNGLDRKFLARLRDRGGARVKDRVSVRVFRGKVSLRARVGARVSSTFSCR